MVNIETKMTLRGTIPLGVFRLRLDIIIYSPSQGIPLDLRNSLSSKVRGFENNLKSFQDCKPPFPKPYLERCQALLNWAQKPNIDIFK